MSGYHYFAVFFMQFMCSLLVTWNVKMHYARCDDIHDIAIALCITAIIDVIFFSISGLLTVFIGNIYSSIYVNKAFFVCLFECLFVLNFCMYLS